MWNTFKKKCMFSFQSCTVLENERPFEKKRNNNKGRIFNQNLSFKQKESA